MILRRPLPPPSTLRPALPHPRPYILRPPHPPHRTLIAPPKPNSGPLMHRSSDRALPPLPRPTSSLLLLTLPLFALALTLSSLAIFNYQKASSSVVSAALYALRTNELAREVLGDEIYFRSRWPWIWGSVDQAHGRVDVAFGVKGRGGRGWVRFRSERRGGRMGVFETQEWNLTTEDGRRIELLQRDGPDPFRREEARVEEVVEGGAEG